MIHGLGKFKNRIRTVFPYLAFILIFLIFTVLSFDRFVTLNNFKIIMQQAAVLAIVAFGLHFAIVRGGIDLSVGSILALAGMVAADYTSKFGAPVGVLMGMGVGFLCGFINGMAHTFLRVPSFICTLGMQMIARGLATIYSNSSPIPVKASLKVIGKYPTILFVTLVVFIISFILYNYTKFGRYAVAVGGDQRVAQLNGIPVRLTSVMVYVFSGILAGLGGIVMAARLGSAVPTTGVGYESQAIASVAMGGASLVGGSGALQNTLIGALITAMLSNGLTIMGVSSDMQEVFTGCIIIVAVFISLDRKKVGVVK